MARSGCLRPNAVTRGIVPAAFYRTGSGAERAGGATAGGGVSGRKSPSGAAAPRRLGPA